ncbi:MAG: TetR family transcriptional regulator [Actinotalea sp.]|nr:TetR family transcriptional regulator [Actinotalea sp.]
MRSTSGEPDGRSADDRTTRARIRDAAIARFAREGIAATSVRAVAADAGVAPSHVVHYFRSKAGLRAACDEHVAALLRELQDEAVDAGLQLDPLAGARRTLSGTPVLAYLARTLVEPSPESDALVDQLVADSVRYVKGLEAAGLVRASDHERMRAVLLTFWSLGSLALHRQLERLTGVDMTDPEAHPEALADYAGATLELFGPGLLTPALAQRLQHLFAVPPDGGTAGPHPTGEPT